MIAFKSSKQTGSVISKITSSHKDQIIQNRKYMLNIINIVLYLAKQGVALRGHSENTDSENQGKS